MKILLASMELSSLTGQPFYTYNLAKGLKEEGHEVIAMGQHADGAMAEMFHQIGVPTYSVRDKGWHGDYDLALIAEHYPEYLDNFHAPKIFNICHSKGSADEPIIDPRITGYIAPREQVSKYWQEKYDIEFSILPIPIDFGRFKEKIPQERYIILAPCTRDTLRRPMLINLLERAKEHRDDSEVWLVGADFGGLDGYPLPPNVRVFPPVTDIEEFYRRADEVAGIFIGTVTIEAWACDLTTSVYDENGEWEYVDRPDDYQKYNYKNVTKQFLSL